MADGATHKAVNLIERAAMDLNAMPVLAARLVQVSQRPDVTPREIEDLLMSDPALTAKILRVVNSAYYGLSRQVKSIGQAVIVLGLQQIRNLAIGVLAYSSINIQNPDVAEQSKRIWNHTLETALASRMVAESMGLTQDEREEAFLVGLLHETGRMFMLIHFTGPYMLIHKNAEGDDSRRLEAAFGATPLQASAFLLKKWNLPEAIIDPIQEMDLEEGMGRVATAVHVAHSILGNLDVLLPEAAADAGLSEVGVADIRNNVTETFKRVQGDYGLAS